MNTQEDKLQEGHDEGRTEIQVEVGEVERQADRHRGNRGEWKGQREGTI